MQSQNKSKPMTLCDILGMPKDSYETFIYLDKVESHRIQEAAEKYAREQLDKQK